MDRKGYASVADFQSCVVDDFSYVRDWPREQWMAEISPIVPKFDNDKCIGCGMCEKLCPYGAITMINKKPQVSDRCMGCGWCMGHCPADSEHHRDGAAGYPAPPSGTAGACTTRGMRVKAITFALLKEV